MEDLAESSNDNDEVPINPVASDVNVVSEYSIPSMADQVPSTSSAPVEKSTNDVCQAKAQQAHNTNVIGTGEKYTGGGIKNTFHGVSYQMKLAMLYIVRGLQQNCQFKVATEVEEAGKLDDLLFLYEDNAIGFFQAKHKLNDDLLINEKQLLSKEEDFSIAKYFHSYCQILSNKKLLNVLKDRDITLMLKTNIGIDSTILNNFELITASTRLTGNKIVALGTEIERSKYYLVNKCSTLYKKLKDLLLELEQPSSRVAENLAKAVVNNKKKSIKVDELFNRYCEWLLNKVLDIGAETNKTQKRYFVTFKNSFFSSSESSVLDFQKTFLDTYLINKQVGKDNTKSVQDDLTGVKFQIPKSFASKVEMAKTRQDEVRKFLDILVFAVNQPSEIKLGDIIEREIGDYVGHSDRQSIACKFKLYIQDWAKQKEGRYLTNKDVERQFAVWGQETLNQIRINDVKMYRSRFRESNEVIKNLSNFLKAENDTNVLCLYYRQMQFSKMKVCQVFESFASEHIEQQFIFCDIKDLIRLENTLNCPVKAFSSQTCNLLFVSLEGELHSSVVLNRLLQVVVESKRNAGKPPEPLKRLIVGIPDKERAEFINKFSFYNLEIKSTSLDDFDNSFSDLDEKSRQLVMEEGCITLKGNNIIGLLKENELSLYIRDEMLWKLISSELKIDYVSVDTNCYYNEGIKYYYINRSLVSLIVDQSITEDTFFHFVREDTSQTNITNQEIVVVSSNEKLFELFRRTNITVHWLNIINNILIWVTSQGTLSNLRKYVAAQDLDPICVPENCIPITNVNDLKNDVVLIRASPGMGKSMLLSHIAEQAKKDTTLLVSKTNLRDYSTELDSLDKESVTLKQAIQFTFFATQIESHQVEESESSFKLLTVQEDGSLAFLPNARFSHLDHLRAHVFCMLYNEEKIVLLLDGFDEIAPDYCKKTLNLLQTLKLSKVRKLWVTTRPYDLTKNLESVLETFAYTLQPLSEDDQLVFIENLWRRKVKTGLTNISLPVKDFLTSLNVSLLSALHKTDRNRNPNATSPNFMGVPLHCYMLAEVFTKDFTKFCSNDKDFIVASNKIKTTFTIFDLYSKFFDIKFDEIRYNVNLKDPTNSIFREIKKNTEADHGKLALLEMYEGKLLIELVPDEDRTKLLTFVRSGNEKLGFVAEIVDNRPQFVHRTFAEYFAAHYLAKILLNTVDSRERKEAAKSLLYDSVTCNLEYYSVLFTFFNYIVVSSNKNKDIFEAAIAGNIRKLSETVNVDEMFDPLNRTPMHLVTIHLFSMLSDIINDCHRADLTTATSKYNYFNIFIQRLCQSMSKCSSDTLFTWTPTHYFTTCHLQFSFPFLVHYFNDVTQDSFGRTPLMLLIKSNPLFYNWIAMYTPINVTCVNTQDHFLKTALHYALENLLKSYSYEEGNSNLKIESILGNHLDIICFLLKHGARIDIPDNKGVMPVDMINSVETEETKNILEELSNYEKREIDKYDREDINLIHSTFEHVENECIPCSFIVDEFSTPGRTILPYAVRQKDNTDVKRNNHNDPRPDTAAGEGKRHVKSKIRRLLNDIVLRQLLEDSDLAFLPVPNSDICTLWFITALPSEIERHIAKIFIENADLLTMSPNNDNYNSIIIFILTRTKTIAQMLLSKFPHLVDVVDLKGRTALHYAIKYRNEDCVTFLIKSNARVDIPDNRGKVPAHIIKVNILSHEFSYDYNILYFIDSLPREVADLLVLTMNLYPILTQSDGDFIVYVLRNTRTIAHALLSRYPDAVNAKDSHGRTALHYAVQTRNKSAICYLINQNAQTDIVDNDGKHPAYWKKHNIMYVIFVFGFIDTLPFKVAKPLVLSMALFPPFSSSDNDLLIHIFKFLHTMASVLWAEYSDLFGITSFNENCYLYFDSIKVSNEVMCILLEIYRVEDFTGNAVNSNEVIKLVIELFSSVKTKDWYRVTPVLRCVEYSLLRPDLTNVNLLSDTINVAACVVNARTKDSGKTALHYVAEIGNVEIAKSLLSHGAWYNVPDLHGFTPLQIAKTHGNIEVLQLLEMVEVLFNCLNDKAYDIAQNALMKEEIDGNLFHCICYITEMPLMHVALKSNNASLIKSFIKCYRFKADFFDCRSLKGRTTKEILNEIPLDITELFNYLDFSSELQCHLISNHKSLK